MARVALMALAVSALVACGGPPVDRIPATVDQSPGKIDVGLDPQTPAPGGSTEPENMVLIAGGVFWMGCVPGDGECADDEKPRHRVDLDSYFIDAREVTAGQYARCVSAGVCSAPSSDNDHCTWGKPALADHPVNGVEWEQARGYCEWSGKRLPTEAEWEFAARGANETAKYPWGDEDSCGRANYCDSNCAWSYKDIRCNDGYAGTSPVGSYPATGPGLYDMAGNVWEWCNDWYDSAYYGVSPEHGPSGPASGMSHVLRGGGWLGYARWLRASERFMLGPYYRGLNVGFRCAKDRPIPGRINNPGRT